MQQTAKTSRKRVTGSKLISRGACEMIWNMADFVGIVAETIVVRYRQMRSEVLRIRQLRTRGFTDMDGWYLGRREIIRMSRLLSAMEERCMSSPAGYDDSSRWLKQRDDDELSCWLESTPSWIFLSAPEHHGKPGTRMRKRKTVRELGVGYCAWREDLKYAAAVLALTDKWRPNSSDSHYRLYRDVFGTDEACVITKKTEAEFNRVWQWVGDNIYDLWD